MIEMLENYIAACQQNIETYLAMDEPDMAAVAAAEAMIRDFQKELEAL